MEYDPVTRQDVIKENVDAQKYDDTLKMYLIQAFKGFGDDDGNVLPDNLESRKALTNDLAVRDFIWARAQAVETIEKAREDAEIKN